MWFAVIHGGMGCNIKTSTTYTTSCNTISSKYYISTTTIKPTNIVEAYLYKLDCKNKTHSSLISII